MITEAFFAAPNGGTMRYHAAVSSQQATSTPSQY